LWAFATIERLARADVVPAFGGGHRGGTGGHARRPARPGFGLRGRNAEQVGRSPRLPGAALLEQEGVLAQRLAGRRRELHEQADERLLDRRRRCERHDGLALLPAADGRAERAQNRRRLQTGAPELVRRPQPRSERFRFARTHVDDVDLGAQRLPDPGQHREPAELRRLRRDRRGEREGEHA
jgi:hypothetical protein